MRGTYLIIGILNMMCFFAMLELTMDGRDFLLLTIIFFVNTTLAFVLAWRETYRTKRPI